MENSLRKLSKDWQDVVIPDPNCDGSDDDTDNPTAYQPDAEQVGGSDNVQHQDNSEAVGAETVRAQNTEIENSNLPPNSADIQAETSSATASVRLPITVSVRRSTRERKPYDKYSFDKEHTAWKVQMNTALDKHGRKEIFQAPKTYEPLSYKDAIRCKDQRLWKIAILEELRALISNHTWILVRLPKGRRLVSSKWVFRVKYTSSGLVDRYKARLVA